MNRKKLLNILSAMLVGVVFVIAMLAVMILSGAISLTRTELVFATSSAEAVYDGKPLTNHNWSMQSGVLKEGHRARVVFTGSQTEAGESDNTIEVQIIDAAGADVTSDYVIRFEPGKLKVTPKSLTVTSKGASKIYDGTPLVNPEYEISDVVIGHRAVVLVGGSQTFVGFSPNTLMLVRILDRNGKDVTDNYRITKQEEPLIVMQGQGSQGGAGGLDFGEIPEGVDVDQLKSTVLYKVLSNRTGKIYLKSQSYGDYTGRGFYEANKYTLLMDEKYSAAYLMSFALQAKKASVGEITVQIVGASYALPYYMAFSEQNGYEIQTDDVQISGSANEYTVQYYVDDVTPAAHKHYFYMMYEKEYRQFVYENYLEIDYETKNYMDGIIASEKLSASDPDIINKVAQFIQKEASYNISHDSSLDKNENIAVAFLRDYKEGVCRHYAMAATMLYRALGIPARYTVGAVADAVEGEWVDVTALMAHAWVEVYIDGIGWKMVEVTGGESAGGDIGGDTDEDKVVPDKKIRPVDVYMKYDGRTTLYAEAILEGFEKYAAQGYKYKNLVVSGSRRDAGISQSTIERINVYDKNGKDVTNEFIFEHGIIQVYRWELNVSSESASLEYGDMGGQNVTYKTDLSRLYSINVEYTSDYNRIGEQQNTFTVTVKMLFGFSDVTDQVKINKTYGKLTIERREITVIAGSAEKAYDGTPLTCEEYFIEGTLSDGDSVYICETQGEQTNIGRSANEIIRFEICNSAGDIVTDKYEIKHETGSLRVTR